MIYKNLISVGVILLLLACFIGRVFGQDLGDRDTCEVECIEYVPANTQIAIPIRIWVDEDIIAIGIPLTFYNSSNTDIVCDSISFLGSVVADLGLYEFAGIDTINYKVTVGAIDFSSENPIHPGSYLFATLYFSTGPTWNPDIGVLIDTYINYEFDWEIGWEIEFDTPDFTMIKPLFIRGCLSTNRPPDFDIVAQPVKDSIIVGDSTTYVVTLAPIFVFDSPCTLSVSGLPSGTFASFDSVSVTPPGSTILTITSLDTIKQEGEYTLFITAKSGGLEHRTRVWLRTFVPNFSVYAVPDMRIVNVGDSASYQITLASTYGFDSPCSLTVAGLPGGVTAYFDSVVVTSPGNTMLRIFTPDTVSREQMSKLTITATGGQFTHYATASLALVIPGNEPPGPFSLTSPSDGAALNPPFTVRWQYVPDPDLFDQIVYTVYYSTDSNFVTYDSINTSGTSRSLIGITELTRYFWKVKAADKFGGVSWSNQTWKFDTPSCIAGDVNFSLSITLADVIYLFNYLFKGGPAPNCLRSADIDSVKGINIGDVNHLILHILRGGPPPNEGPFPDTPIPVSTSDKIFASLDNSFQAGPEKHQFNLVLKSSTELYSASIPLTYRGSPGVTCDSISYSGLLWWWPHQQGGTFTDTIDVVNRTILIGAVNLGSQAYFPPGTHTLAKLFFTIPDTAEFYIDSTFIEPGNSLLLCGGEWGRDLIKPQFIFRGGYRIQAAPDSQICNQGDSVNYVIRLFPRLGFNSPCSLSVDGLPPGAIVNFNPAVITPPDSSILTIKLVYIEREAIHRLRIVAKSEDNIASTELSLIAIVPGNEPPSSFSLYFPSDGDTLRNVIEFCWEATSDPDLFDTVNYVLYLSLDSLFSSVDSVVLSYTYYYYCIYPYSVGLMDDAYYYWRVKAMDTFGNSRWSTQTWTFYVPPFILGDVDWDGTCGDGDIFSLFQNINTGQLPIFPNSGDVDSIGGINIGDVNHLISYLHRSGVPPYRAPFPDSLIPISTDDTVYMRCSSDLDSNRYQFNVYLRNTREVYALSIPLQFISSGSVSLDSFSFLGTRLEGLYTRYFPLPGPIFCSDNYCINYNDSAKTLLFTALADSIVWSNGYSFIDIPLLPGRGDILKLFFTIPHAQFYVDTTSLSPSNYLLLSTGPNGRELVTPQFTVAGLPGSPLISKITPDNGVNTDTLLVNIEGMNFHPGLTVVLSHAGQTNIVGENTTLLNIGYLTTAFDLIGREPGKWDVVVTNPNGKADTLVSGFTVMEFGPEAVLRSVANASNLLKDIQAQMWVSSWLDTMTLYENVHLFYKAKAPDKTKISIPESELISEPIISIVTNGWKQFLVNHYTGGIDEVSLLEEGNITPSEFEMMDLNYNIDKFLANHNISLSGSYLHSGEVVYIVEAVPTWSDRLYSKLNLHVKYNHGLVHKLITYLADTVTATAEVTQESLIGGQHWLATKFENRMSLNDTLLRTEVVLDSIQINAGISDNEFVVDNIYLGKALQVLSDTLSKNTSQQVSPLGKVVESYEGPPPSAWAEWQQSGIYKPNPVFLLHGFWLGSAKSWEKAINSLRDHYQYDSRGYSIYLRNPEFYDKLGSIDGPGGWASYVSAWVNDRLGDIGISRKKVVLVGHSAGGLAAREYVVQNNGWDYGDPDASTKVDKIITVGTPNSGACLATVGRSFFAASAPHVGRTNWSRYLIDLFAQYRAKSSSFNLIDLIYNVLPSKIVEDMDITSPFISNLNDPSKQHANSIRYITVYSLANKPWPFPRFPWGDGIVEFTSQVGIPTNPRVASLKDAFHWDETNAIVDQDILMKLLDDTKPDVEIIPINPLKDCVSYDCSLRVRLSEEYLPATTELDIYVKKKPSFANVGSVNTWFHPDPNWTPEGEGSSCRGVLDTLINYPGPGSYGILVGTKNPAGLIEGDYIELSLGVDLLVWVWGTGRARPGFEKTYTIECKNLGTVTASNITVTNIVKTFYTILKSDTWQIATLAGGESKSFTTKVTIPLSTPLGTVLLSKATISSTEEDMDLSNNTDTESETIQGVSVDPNDKEVNPVGFSLNGFIPSYQTLKYTIFFENLASASDSATYVTISDTLDLGLDWRTLSFGPISHPDKCTTYFDPVTGVITWYFDEIGLPPNKIPPEGEGFVTYAIKPKHFLESGTQIKNRAAIKFDYNPWMLAPMDSSFVVNTIDAYPPNSRVHSLSDTVPTEFEVTWYGTDDSLGFGSGIRTYTIYFSRNGSSDSVWIADTADTSAVFQGKPNSTYCFYCIATDSVGNVEGVPAAPDACTRTQTICTAVPGDANSDGELTMGDIVATVHYIFGKPKWPSCGSNTSLCWLSDLLCRGDWDGDGAVSMADVIRAVHFLFKKTGGPYDPVPSGVCCVPVP